MPSASPETESEKEGTIFSCFSSESQFKTSPDDRSGDPTPISPNEGLYLYSEQMLKMGKMLDIDISVSDNKPKGKILS